MLAKRKQVVQRCPNCGAKYDVGIYVSGQRVRCRRCGIKFAVVRNDTQIEPAPAAPPVRAQPSPHKPDPAKDELPPGTLLGGYRLDATLGRGAMGTVYRATQLSLDRTVAVKIMSSDLVSQREFILRFRREAAALATLAHTHVVSIIDQGRSDNTWFFVMEYVDGPTLRRVIAGKKLGFHEALRWGYQVGLGLAFAHSRGVVHRDLKPENVLLADDGAEGRIAKICDFGLADILYSDRSFVNLTGSRISMGTVNYMAPEQRKDAGRVDQRADVYSYGVLLYEMLTGELPIGRFAEPNRLNPRIHAPLNDALTKSLEPDARRRFVRVRDIVDAIYAGAS